MATLEEIKKYTFTKRKLARDFNIPEKNIQQIVDFIIEYFINNKNTITLMDVVNIASEQGNVLYDLFKTNKEIDDKITKIKELLNNITLCISSNGVIYNLKVGS